MLGGWKLEYLLLSQWNASISVWDEAASSECRLIRAQAIFSRVSRDCSASFENFLYFMEATTSFVFKIFWSEPFVASDSSITAIYYAYRIKNKEEIHFTRKKWVDCDFGSIAHHLVRRFCDRKPPVRVNVDVMSTLLRHVSQTCDVTLVGDGIKNDWLLSLCIDSANIIVQYFTIVTSLMLVVDRWRSGQVFWRSCVCSVTTVVLS